MNKIRTIKPGQPGTKNLYDFYGDKLLCVRYRYNYEKMECIKTVELVIETKKMKIRKFKHHPKKIVNIIVRYGEAHLGRLVRQAGGEWNREKKVWQLPYEQVEALDLLDRIIDE